MIATAIAAAAVELSSQERFSFFQASTPESVERMLTLAELRDDDVIVDLGSGDGVIPLTAARLNPRLRGWGVDINANLVAESNERARKDGVADRVHFKHQNAFDVDLREATVVTMWLFPELMRLLRPMILERARPGTRVLTSTWDLGSSWRPDKVISDAPPVYLWIVPARVAGGWDWAMTVAGKRIRYGVVLDQQFQVIEGAGRAGDRREVLDPATLQGDDIAFSLRITLDGLGLTQHDFTGKVAGDLIVGRAQVTLPDQAPLTLPWRARRTERPHYFRPTGPALLQRPPER